MEEDRKIDVICTLLFVIITLGAIFGNDILVFFGKNRSYTENNDSMNIFKYDYEITENKEVVNDKNIFQYMENDKYGLIDVNEKVIVKANFDKIGDFSEGLAPARLNNKDVFINEEGEVVIENEAGFIIKEKFHFGAAIVTIDDKDKLLFKDGKLSEGAFKDLKYVGYGVWEDTINNKTLESIDCNGNRVQKHKNIEVNRHFQGYLEGIGDELYITVGIGEDMVVNIKENKHYPRDNKIKLGQSVGTLYPVMNDKKENEFVNYKGNKVETKENYKINKGIYINDNVLKYLLAENTSTGESVITNIQGDIIKVLPIEYEYVNSEIIVAKELNGSLKVSDYDDKEIYKINGDILPEGAVIINGNKYGIHIHNMDNNTLTVYNSEGSIINTGDYRFGNYMYSLVNNFVIKTMEEVEVYSIEEDKEIFKSKKGTMVVIGDIIMIKKSDIGDVYITKDGRIIKQPELSNEWD